MTNPDYCDGITAYGYVVMWVGHNLSVHNPGSAAFTADIAPNPNNGNFMLRGTMTSNSDQKFNIVVTNVLGQVVYTGETESSGGIIDKKLNFNDAMPDGVYILNLDSGIGSVKLRFEIRR